MPNSHRRSSAPSLPCIATAEPFGPLLDRICRDVDTVAGTAVLFTAFLLTNLEHMPHGLEGFLAARLTIRNFLVLVAFGVIWRLVCVATGLYDQRAVTTWRAETWRVLSACGLASMVALVLPAISTSNAFRLSAVLLFFLGISAVMLLHRTALRVLLVPRRRSREDVVIVGSGPRAERAYRALCDDPESRSNVLGFVDTGEHECLDEIRTHTLGRLDELEAILMRRAVDQVLITLPVRSRYADVQKAIHTCSSAGVRATYLADVFESPLRQPRFDGSSQLPVVAMPVAAEDYRLLVKRMIDIAGGTLCLALATPILAVAALAVKLTSPGPVLFVQERYGLKKRRFRMYKLRTMVTDAEAMQPELEAHNEALGPVFKIRRDPRVTPVGRFLRRASIDELPQLWNVIRGDMSLVGPRPLPMRDVQKFTEGALMRRFSMRPGLTCVWQVSGRSTIGFADWVRLDLQYIDQWSLALDLLILAKTVPAVLRGTGAA